MKTRRNQILWVKRLTLIVAVLLVCTALFAQEPVDNPNAPLPQDTGMTGLKQELQRLRTTARLMHTTAHPDDEDGGMLVLESRGKGVDALLFTLTRGEGGQNRTGSNLFDELGVVRTLELLAADRYYDVEQRFSRVADFGFSKTPEETFQKWHGHDIPLSDMVRVIRTFRPDVIVSRFQGNERDGHGHHQACGILTREAFRAAADPARFPEQLKEGLRPWQAKKLYIDNVQRFGDPTPPAPDQYTLALDTGTTDPLLGMSYVQFAMQGLRHQLSQGAGAWNVRPGPHVSYYRLVDSVSPMPKPGVHEISFFDGIDTSLPGLAARLGSEQNKVPFLRPALVTVAREVEQASAAADNNMRSAVEPLLAGLQTTNRLIRRVEASSLSATGKQELLLELRTKQRQFEKAANIASGVQLHALVQTTGSNPFVAVPGQSFAVRTEFTSSGTMPAPVHLALVAPVGWYVMTEQSERPGVVTAEFHVTVSPDQRYTRPCNHRGDPQVDTVYTAARDTCSTLPLPKPPLFARATYTLAGHKGVIEVPVQVLYKQDGKVRPIDLAVAPAFSTLIDPPSRVVPMGASRLEVSATAFSNVTTHGPATLRLHAPEEWRTVPEDQSRQFTPGQQGVFRFVTVPQALRESKYDLLANLNYVGKNYAEQYTVISRPDLGAAYYYQPATQHISAVDVKIPNDLKVGYIMGAGDDIPTVLRQIGMNVTVISPEGLAGGDLGKYGTIVVGIRAYDTREDVRKNNQRLLDYASKGGTLLVQYNTNISEFNSGKFTPYAADLSRDRVTVEEAPVEVLTPDNPIFHFPNAITATDFNGWVQERGLYFMNSWDQQFTPLVSSHDPGEQPMNGGLLEAHYGKGTYIYTGYAFFRQLPVGVPGAIRLFVNLVSAGHER
jgi:LmbE family N-acetylglucosaminyl deacetylase